MAPKELNISLGSKVTPPQSKLDLSRRSGFFEGVAENAETIIPMALGVMLTLMKMDQFQRPLANTAMEMIDALAPQIEKDATAVGQVINQLTTASHNVKETINKNHHIEFTKDDKVHLIKLLMNEDNYLDSYDATIEFLKRQSPGFLKALYKTLMANNKNNIVHAASEKGKQQIREVSDNRQPDKNKREVPNEEILSRYMSKLDKTAALAKKSSSKIGKKVLGNITDKNVDKKTIDNINQKKKIDDEFAERSLNKDIKESVEKQVNANLEEEEKTKN